MALVDAKRCCIRAVRGAHSWFRKIAPGFCQPTTGKLSLPVNQAVNGYLFQIREGEGSKRRGIGFAFHQLCPGYSGPHIPTAPYGYLAMGNLFPFLVDAKSLPSCSLLIRPQG